MTGQEQMGCCPILSEGASRVKPETTCPLSSSPGLSWLLLEVQDRGIILYDPQGVLANKLEAVRQRMRELGTKKVMLGAIKTAKYYGFGSNDVIVTILTDAIDRYHSVMEQMTATYGPMDETEAAVRLVSIFHKQKLDWIKEATRDLRHQWHNLKYYTWVEQQGKTVEELNAQKDPTYWLERQARVAEVDEKLRAFRES